jgi:hypothetical protein
MDADLSISLIKATVQIDQPSSPGKQVVGTGFLLSVPRGDQPPEVVLVTAAHVLEMMKAEKMRVGWRVETPQGWSYRPTTISIRNADGPLWMQHPTQDIAVIAVEVPPMTQASTLPVTALADEKTFDTMKIDPGEEMSTLGYPYGLSSNNEGFPILRSGRLASYPLGPTRTYPTFLIDMTAISGNSGGPVFLNEGKSDAPKTPVITGVLTRQVEQDTRRLELGLVTHAVFVRQTLDLLLKKELLLRAQAAAAIGPETVQSSVSAAAAPPPVAASGSSQSSQSSAYGGRTIVPAKPKP